MVVSLGVVVAGIEGPARRGNWEATSGDLMEPEKLFEFRCCDDDGVGSMTTVGIEEVFEG